MPDATTQIYALVVATGGQTEAVLVCPVRACMTQPDGALKLLQAPDPGALAFAAYGNFDRDRNEAPRPLYVCHPKPARANLPGREVHGDSASLPLGLAALADLYGFRPQGFVVATGTVAKDDEGRVGRVEHVRIKVNAALSHCERLPQRSNALVLVPVDGCEELPASVYERAESLGVQLAPVASLAAAAALAFGKDFHAAPAAIASARLAQRSALSNSDYQAAVAAVQPVENALMSLPTAAPLGQMVRVESLAIAAWAASRLAPATTVKLRGEELPASFALATLERECRELREFRGIEPWPETLALLDNLEAAIHLGASLDFGAGLRLAERGQARPGLANGVHGERRKLQGTAAQLRWRLGLRRVALGMESEGRTDLTLAVEEASAALDAAMQSGVADANDRARVRVYLANAHLARGAVGDGQRAEELLRQVLGFDEAWRAATAPQQDPGWALRVLYLGWAVSDPARAAAHWIEHGGQLETSARGQSADGGPRRLAELLSPGNTPRLYDEPLAALIARSAVAAGDVELAIAMTEFGCRGAYRGQKVTLRTIAWWWPLVEEPALASVAALRELRSAVCGIDGWEIERPEGPSRDSGISELLASMCAPDLDTRMKAWRRVYGWIGEPTGVTAVVQR